MYTSIQTAFNAGEISPSLYGRVDVEKYRFGCSTMRNCFVDYRGGSTSRAGLAFVGQCKQPGTSAPPRDIPFQYNISQGFVLEFGGQYMRVKSDGAYVTEAAKDIIGASQSNPAAIQVNGHGWSAEDWIYISGMGGMTAFNGLTWIVNSVIDPNNITIRDLFGNPVDSTTYTAYTSGGTAARIYTLVTPYAAVDLPYLKYTQSANTMSLTCVNLPTQTEYQPQDLQRISAANWTISPTVFTAQTDAPAGVAVTASNSTTKDTWYSYVVTAVDATTGEESVASSPAQAENNNIAIFAGSNAITWNAVAGAGSYNIYKATPSYNTEVTVGVSYGYIGTAFGSSFTDTNIIADFSDVPPVHNDPFARSAIIGVNPTAGGASYTQATIGEAVTTSTGIGFAGTPVVVGGAFTAFIIANGGSGYALTDTITITDGGVGVGATATLSFGPADGTYPGVVSYFQQRRAYANSINQPDTYWLTQPGLYNNMDSAIPISAGDAITGSPWAQQVNGIQFMVPMPNGLIVLTGNGSWLLNGSNGAALTPIDQNATAQAYNGCSDIVPPILANFHILYVQSKGSIVRDLAFDFVTNVYTGNDLTILSNHLVADKQILQWAWAEEPFKVVWAVRNDGIMLSLTFIHEQKVFGWSRHDTNGLFVSVCSITELPVDAVYMIVKRYVRGAWYYYSERMDDRNWQNVEDCFCVDAGLAYPMSFPDATLTASEITGDVTFTADADVFSSDNLDDVIRMGGGKATIISFTSPREVVGRVSQDITAVLPDDPDEMPVPQVSGLWSVSTPTSTVGGLNHLLGKEVAILGDGSVFPNQTVVNLGNGKIGITLSNPCSQVTVGLPFIAQTQALYLDPPSQSGTTQTKRKNIYSVGLRVENTRGISIGVNQPDAATQPNQATVAWTKMVEVKERNATIHAGSAIPLHTGDIKPTLVKGSWDTKGQIAVQQTYPLPMKLLSFVPYYEVGDTSG